MQRFRDPLHVLKARAGDVMRWRTIAEAPLVQEVDIGSSVEITLDTRLRQLSVHGKNRSVLFDQTVGSMGGSSSSARDSMGTTSGTVLGTAGFPQLKASRILRVLVTVRWPRG
jgi:hypothetical protein